MSVEQQPEVSPIETPKRSPLDVMMEIHNEVYPVPEPPEDASWLNKTPEELTEEDKRARWDFMIKCQAIIANSPTWIPRSHPRYNEYKMAEREYQNWFRIPPEDLLKEFTI